MPEYPPIPGVKVVSVTGQFTEDEDPTLPWKVTVNLRPPEFMNVTFVMLYGGTEAAVVQAPTREELEKFLEAENMTTHPRLRNIVFNGPDGFEETIDRDASFAAARARAEAAEAGEETPAESTST